MLLEENVFVPKGSSPPGSSCMCTSVCHVQVVGRPLTPVFDVDINEASGTATLKYFPEKLTSTASLETNDSSGWHGFSFRQKFNHLRATRGWNHPILNTLLGVADSDSEDDEREPY